MIDPRKGACAVIGLAAFVAGGGCERGTLTGSGSGGRGIIPGTGSGGAIAAGTGGTGATQTGTGTAGSRSQCGSIVPTARVTPAVMIVLDTSISMNDPIDNAPCNGDCAAHSKWAAAVAGIGAAVDATEPAATWGLSFLASSSDACTAGGIAAPIPSSGATIRLEMDRHSNAGLLTGTGATPMRAAVDLAAAYLTGRPEGANGIILLVTDSPPDCIGGDHGIGLSDIGNTVLSVMNALNAGVTTAVIGLATIGGPADAKLSYIAQSGGAARAGDQAYYPASSAGDITAAINTIVTRASVCTYAIPPPPPQDVAGTREHIAVLADGAAVPQDASNGWTYADTTHTSVTLQGSACDAVSDGAPHEILIDFICPIL